MNCVLCSAADCVPMPRHPEAELYRCRVCSHAFTRTESIRHPEEYAASYYDEDHKNWFEHPNVALFERVLSEVPLGASLADVGCGRGDFLRFARSSRPDLRLTGIDLSPNEDEPGIRFLRGDILATDMGERFDAVVSLLVIEHVEDVRGFVNALVMLAKPAGVVVVTTINDDSLLYAAARMGRSVGVPLAFDRLYSAHHLHHFTRSSMVNLLLERRCEVKAHWDHTAPIEAMDIPVRQRWLDAGLRVGLRILWAAGRLTKRSYLQTVVCRPPQCHECRRG